MNSTNYVISIGRSFGSGGRAIGRELSGILKVPCFDNELLKAAAEEYGFSKELFAYADERRPSVFKRFATQIYGLQETYNLGNNLSVESLYQAQSLVIRSIARKGSCIIIGRTADYILRDFPNLLKIFIHAPVAYRARKIFDRGEASSEIEAIEMARRKDKAREEYYNYFTGRKWGSASNYDLSLDSSLLSPEDNAEIIVSYLKKITKI